jgi:integrase
VGRVLAATGQDEALAESMPHGAVRWRAEHDKLGYEELTPIGPALRAALEGYLAQHPAIGDAPLFPSDTRPAQCVDQGVLAKWLLRAEARAGLPKLERGTFHPYRRLFVVLGKHLPDVEVAKAGGWRDLYVMKRSYQRPEAAGVLRVVENAGAGHTLDTP